MKKSTLLLFALLLTTRVFAQDISLGRSGNLNPFYADLVSKVSALNGDWGLFGGARAGYNINANFGVGLIGHGLIPVSLSDSYINPEGRDELHFGYGGAEVTYKYSLTDKVYLSGNVIVGAGRVDYEKLGGFDYFFITEPGAGINYRITDWFGVGASASYRFAAGVNYADFSDASFSGWSTDVSFKFGF